MHNKSAVRLTDYSIALSTFMYIDVIVMYSIVMQFNDFVFCIEDEVWTPVRLMVILSTELNTHNQNIFHSELKHTKNSVSAK